MIVAEIVLWGCGTYLAIGMAVSVPFIWRGIGNVDAAAHGTSVTFRLLILPGCVALWPLILQRWLHAQKGAEHS
jgi:hypothetical protein